jgi:uncharacterized protein involved in exopolysaccharide biosynthesis
MQSESHGPGNGSSDAARRRAARRARVAAGDPNAEREVLNTLDMAQTALGQVDERLARLRHTVPTGPGVAPVASDSDSLRAVLYAVRRSWWIILICGAIAAAAGVAVAQTKPTRYQAVTSLLFTGNSYQQAVAGGYNPINVQTEQATISDLLTPGLLGQATARAGLGPADPYAVTTVGSGSSNVMGIQATTGDARTAAALANATANDLVLFLQRLNAKELTKARAVLRNQIATARLASDRHLLVGELNNLADLQALDDDQVQIVQPALIPGIPVSRGTIRTGAIALVLGILFGLAISLLRRRDPVPAR